MPEAGVVAGAVALVDVLDGRISLRTRRRYLRVRADAFTRLRNVGGRVPELMIGERIRVAYRDCPKLAPLGVSIRRLGS